MLTPSHIAASYILSQLPLMWGMPLNGNEILAVVVAGNVVDLDYFFGLWQGKYGDEHHQFFTHTPFFVLSSWTVLYLMFANNFSFGVWLLLLISAIIHLVLDDLGYWFCRIGWQKVSTYPQINWLYPLKPFAGELNEDGQSFLIPYLTKAKVNVFFEVTLILSSTFLWMGYL